VFTRPERQVREFISVCLEELSKLDEERERLIILCREIIRLSRTLVSKVHTGENPSSILISLRSIVRQLSECSSSKPELYYTGGVLSALTEYVESVSLYCVVCEDRIPSPSELGVTAAPYLLGLADLVGELRRQVLERIKHEEYEEAERLFRVMESIYDALRPIAIPDALAPGLRRKVDIARGLVENTRRDLLFFRRASELESKLSASR